MQTITTELSRVYAQNDRDYMRLCNTPSKYPQQESSYKQRKMIDSCINRKFSRISFSPGVIILHSRVPEPFSYNFPPALNRFHQRFSTLNIICQCTFKGYIYIYIYIYIYVCVCMHACIHYIYIYVCVCVYIYIYIYIHAHTHAYIYIYIYIYWLAAYC